MLDFAHPLPALTAKQLRGTRNHLSGDAAETAVLRAYLDRGASCLASKWRAPQARHAGEIDLVLQDGETFVFVEVKTARSWEAAMDRIRPAQVRRIYTAAELFLAQTPSGLWAETRFDAALVDSAGRVEIREGVLTLF